MEIRQFAPPSPPFVWWGDKAPDLSEEVVRLNVEIMKLKAENARLKSRLLVCEKAARDALDMD